MLLRLAECDTSNEHIIIILKPIDRSTLFYDISQKNIKLYSLNYTGIKSAHSVIKLYFKYLQLHTPDVIQTWMYHSNVFGGVLAYIKGHRNIVWNIRSAEISYRSMKKKTIFLVFVEALLSYFIPKKIISCSKRAIEVHKRVLYCKSKFIFIPNGIQDHYILDKKINMNKKPVIGFVARLDTQKNHDNFLKSIQYIKRPVKFVLLGRGVDNINLSEYRISDDINVTLSGEVTDVFSFYDTFDFLILPSVYGEAFPNVLLESMSRGIVCIASDVGDSYPIMSTAGYRIKDPYNPESIASAINSALDDFIYNHSNYLLKSNSSINRIKSNYRLTEVVKMYNVAWAH